MQIISAKHVLTMDAKPIVNGALVVKDGKIVDVGPQDAIISQYKAAPREDYPHHVVMPGLINAHTHLDMTLHRDYPLDPVRSIGVNVNFIEWLIGCIEYKKKTAPTRFRESVQAGIESCIDSGTTCVADQGSFEGIFQSLKEAGLRGVVFPEIISYDGKVSQDLFESALALVEKYADYDADLIRVGMAPYAPYALSRQILKITAAHCKSVGAPLMLQAAESFSEMEFFYNSSGDIAEKLFPYLGWGNNLPPNFKKTPLEYLEEIRFLEAGPILVGCVQATPADLDRVKKAGATVVITPRANHFLQVGEAPVGRMIEKEINIALGTDGVASTANLSLWDELRFLHERFKEKDVDVPAKKLLEMATKNAASALGIEKDVGMLQAGKQADYLVVDASEFPSKGDLHTHLIENTKTYHVKKVVVNGKTLKNI